jgi:hypothetical protein
MRRGVMLFCIGWIACGASTPMTLPPNDHLAFGMTRDQVAAHYAEPLVYLKGRPGSELYMVRTRSSIPGLYPVDKKVFLQFRNHRLSGWKRDWRMQERTFF